MKLSLKKISTITISIIAITTLIGLLFSLENYVAKAKDLEQLEIRLDQKIIQDKIDFFQTQIWKFEDRYGYNVEQMKIEIRDTYRRLKKRLKEAEKELNILMKEEN